MSGFLCINRTAVFLAFIGVIAALAGLLLLPSASPGQAAPVIRYVATNGDDVSDSCDDPDQPCLTIQHAVDVAGGGDEVRVAAGRYTELFVRNGTTSTVRIEKPLLLRGGYTRFDGFASSFPEVYPTILDPQFKGRGIRIQSPRNSQNDPTGIPVTIDGFQIVNGKTNFSGGGLLSFEAELTLRNNRFIDNTAFDCAGAYIVSGVAGHFPIIVENNLFQRNVARFTGGGMCVIAAPFTLRGNVSYDNHVPTTLFGDNDRTNPGGGGLRIDLSFGTIDGDHIIGNRARQQAAGATFVSSNVTVINTIIADNVITPAGNPLGVAAGV